MHIIHDLNNFDAPWNASALTLGVFDGMHRGHQALVQRLQKRSRKKNRARILLTYHPHPDLILGKRKTKPGLELFSYDEKLALFQKFDLDAVIFLSFTQELAKMTALRFLKEIIIEKLHADHIIIGYDQCFGHGRRGNYTFLKKRGRKYGYQVERIKAVRQARQVISSTRIRSLLKEGRIRSVNQLLGFEFFACGTVIRGSRRGAKLGFPTANLEIAETKAMPSEGVYGAIVERGGLRYRAMVNIGRNPTFGTESLGVEAHILDFNDDLYGEQIRVSFKERFRDEIKFDSVEELVTQLKKDRVRTRKLRLHLK